MMRREARLLGAVSVSACVVWAAGAVAQASAAKAAVVPVVAKGTVTGRVMCDDTQKAAPFADVSLIHVPGPGDPGRFDFTNLRTEGPPRIVEIMVSTQSGLDGTFKMPDIPEGEYWVIAQSAGYIFPVGTVPQGVQRTDVAKIMQNVQTVRVSADRTSDVRLTMQRGASIMGRVMLEDGTPLSSLSIRLAPLRDGTARRAAA